MPTGSSALLIPPQDMRSDAPDQTNFPIGISCRPFARLSWHLVTGEYPPQPGGVSDYTRLVARGLAATGDKVHVWAPRWAVGKRSGSCSRSVGGLSVMTSDSSDADWGVIVHRLRGSFGLKDLLELNRGLRKCASPRRILVQYVPHAFGYKAMNVGLCLWLRSIRRRERIWVMFHEVCFPWGWGRPLRHNILGAVNRLMATLACQAAERVFIAIPDWGTLLPALARPDPAPEWLPVPSNISTHVAPGTSSTIRQALALDREHVVLGSFGTFSEEIGALLREPLVGLLRPDPRRVALLLGRGSDVFAEKVRKENPELAPRLLATGALEAPALAAHLTSCDLLLQPYPDGASSRRGSLMAGLALGLPILTTAGFRTEDVWQKSRAVRLVAGGAEAWIAAAEELLQDTLQRTQLGQNAALLYRDRFALERTIHVLRASAMALAG